MIYALAALVFFAWLFYKVLVNSSLGYTGLMNPVVIALLLIVGDMAIVCVAWVYFQ